MWSRTEDLNYTKSNQREKPSIQKVGQSKMIKIDQNTLTVAL